MSGSFSEIKRFPLILQINLPFLWNRRNGVSSQSPQKGVLKNERVLPLHCDRTPVGPTPRSQFRVTPSFFKRPPKIPGVLRGGPPITNPPPIGFLRPPGAGRHCVHTERFSSKNTIRL